MHMSLGAVAGGGARFQPGFCSALAGGQIGGSGRASQREATFSHEQSRQTAKIRNGQLRGAHRSFPAHPGRVSARGGRPKGRGRLRAGAVSSAGRPLDGRPACEALRRAPSLVGSQGSHSRLLAPLSAASGASIQSGQQDCLVLQLRWAGCLGDDRAIFSIRRRVSEPGPSADPRSERHDWHPGSAHAHRHSRGHSLVPGRSAHSPDG